MKRFISVFIYILTLQSLFAQNGINDISITWIDAPAQVSDCHITMKWGIKAKSQITDICIMLDGVSVKGINAVTNDEFDMKKSQALKLKKGNNKIEIIVTTAKGSVRESRNVVLLSDENNNHNDDFGNYENIDSVFIAAYQGEEEAQFLLAQSYLQGKNGLGKDMFESSLWFKKSAEHDYPQSQYEYAIALMEGRGIMKNIKSAIYWLKQAVTKECADAQLKLGICYETGEGVERNIEKAKELYRKCPLAEAKQRLTILDK